MNARRRGAAMMTAILVVGLLTTIVVALLLYVHQQRLRNIATARASVRDSCAASGMQYARAYFGRNQDKWNTYLAKPAGYSKTAPHPYNPVASSWNPFPANPSEPDARGKLQTAHPELFADLDGDGQSDVYIYIRDNDDEGLPAAQDWGRDNDQIVIVGAVCTSSTMLPRRQDGTVDPELVVVEGLLSYNITGSPYNSQAFGGSAGSGNLN